MKRLLSKLRSKRRNQGSGLVLVIVAVAFVGILVGSLLTAVGYAYRLKLYDYNAKDNFYYLEQAMDEIYTGIGNDTLTRMQEAYSDVINGMVTYDLDTHSYTTQDKDVMNETFRNLFLQKVSGNENYATNKKVKMFIQSFISNSDVTLASTPTIVRLDETGGVVSSFDATTKFSSILIKNVVLSRTANYNRSTAKGDYRQSISTDIMINKPDFTMEFSSLNVSYSNLFDYSMVADNGIEVRTPADTEVSISGNIYAAADYYDKGYNFLTSQNNMWEHSGYMDNAAEGDEQVYNNKYMVKGGTLTEYSYDALKDSSGVVVSGENVPSVVTKGGKVSYNFNNTLVGDSNDANDYINAWHFYANNAHQSQGYDGIYEESANSGLLIKGSKVSLQSAEIIVPGSISVMDGGQLALYGKNGALVGETDVWADNIVLGNKDKSDATGPRLLARANLHVRDDMELNADNSYVELIGRYYGFGNSSKSDRRSYLSSVDPSLYQITDGEDTSVRGHFNSSAIVVNGQNTTMNLSELNTLFLAGRTYVELSRNKTNTASSTSGTETVDTHYSYYNNVGDFKSGESLSLRPNQLAYVPVNVTGVTAGATDAEGKPITVSEKCQVPAASGSGTEERTITYYPASLPSAIQESALFYHILGAGTKIDKLPCIRYDRTRTNGTVVTTETDYFYDFDAIFTKYYLATGKAGNYTFNYDFVDVDDDNSLSGERTVTINNKEDLAKQFIIYYNMELNNYAASSARPYLMNISDFEDLAFQSGSITVPTDGSKLYSSGALTTVRAGVNFTITDTAKNGITSALTSNVSSHDNLIGSLTGEYEEPTDATTQMQMISGNMNKSEINVANIANDMERRYQYIKWALEGYNKLEDANEFEYVKRIYDTRYNEDGDPFTDPANDADDPNYSFIGEGLLTPINRFMNYNQISRTITPDNFKLQSGYSVWVSEDDVIVSSDRDDGVVQGIVVTRGNVLFDNTVSRFEGLIISGDKIFVANVPGYGSASASEAKTLTAVTASAEIVRSILNECMTRVNDSSMSGGVSNGEYAKNILKLFKTYETYAVPTSSKTIDLSVKTIDTIQTSDVVRYDNWMKNVVVIDEDDDESGTLGEG